MSQSIAQGLLSSASLRILGLIMIGSQDSIADCAGHCCLSAGRPITICHWHCDAGPGSRNGLSAPGRPGAGQGFADSET
jgi:hypothetical protein